MRGVARLRQAVRAVPSDVFWLETTSCGLSALAPPIGKWPPSADGRNASASDAARVLGWRSRSTAKTAPFVRGDVTGAPEFPNSRTSETGARRISPDARVPTADPSRSCSLLPSESVILLFVVIIDRRYRSRGWDDDPAEGKYGGRYGAYYLPCGR